MPQPGSTRDGPTDATERIADASVPLETLDPAAELDDFEPLKPVFADATVVGMGESTHGTREFFRVKHRLFRYLVERLGFRLFGLEANFAETLAINDYVLDGEGDPRDALAGINYWTWRTESMLSLIEWVRSHNEGRDPARKVQFHGFDTGRAGPSARAVAEYLAAVDSDSFAEHRDDLERLADDGLPTEETDAFESRLETARTLVEKLRTRLHDARESYVATTSEAEWERALRQLRIIEQAERIVRETYDQSNPGKLREQFMAENVSWLLEHTDSDSVALWAHNGHVMDGDLDGMGQSMGSNLRAEYGDDYYALALDFGYGAFQSVGDSSELETFTLECPAEGTLLATLTDVDHSPFVVDFDSVADDHRLDATFGKPAEVHRIGGIFDTDWDRQRYHMSVVPNDVFDGLLFVEESSPSVHI